MRSGGEFVPTPPSSPSPASAREGVLRRESTQRAGRSSGLVPGRADGWNSPPLHPCADAAGGTFVLRLLASAAALAVSHAVLAPLRVSTGISRQAAKASHPTQAAAALVRSADGVRAGTVTYLAQGPERRATPSRSGARRPYLRHAHAEVCVGCRRITTWKAR